ncbi:MAG: hypothetical protein LBT23_08090 [Synergistaceae bacterium]|jgi:hypothetical protein|nr:hypothetical protein [Synergistaceae bacterium]
MFLAILKGSFAGLVIGILMVALLGRFGLLRRKGRARNILAKLWYAYIPLLLMASGAAWFGISHANSLAVDFANEIRPEVTALSAEFAESIIEAFEESGAISGDIQAGQVMSIVGGYIDEYFDTALLTKLGGYSSYVRGLAASIRPYVSAALSDYIEQRVIRLAAGGLNISEKRLVEMWNTDIVTALRSGLVMDIIEAQIDKRFDSARGPVKILTVILALFPLLEIALSRKPEKIPQVPRPAAPAA